MALALTRVALCASLSMLLRSASALDNGAADTPPLGWCSWQRYRCAIACNDSTSKDCFNERLIRDTADAMAAGPLKAAGYEYVALDDCWQAPRRKGGHVQADPHRFPSGIKALADYVHSKGLKFGV
jgi:alpha-galactosidase